MTREDLEEVFHIEKEIADLENRIQKIEKQCEMASDVVQNGYKKHAVIHGIDLVRKHKLDNNYDKLEKFKNNLKQKKKDIEDYIETIQNSEIRQIFRYRYLDGKNWVQVAHKMNETYKNKTYNEDSVRMKHDRYINKIKKY